MELKQLIELRMKEAYLKEMMEAKDKHFHDFPKYLEVTKAIINRYEGDYPLEREPLNNHTPKQIAYRSIENDIKEGELLIDKDSTPKKVILKCNCESCRNDGKEAKEILDNVIRDLFVKPLVNPLEKFRKEEFFNLSFDEDYAKLKEFHDKQREKGTRSAGVVTVKRIEEFCRKYGVSSLALIEKLNEDEQ